MTTLTFRKDCGCEDGGLLFTSDPLHDDLYAGSGTCVEFEVSGGHDPSPSCDTCGKPWREETDNDA